ncbi:phytoene/squalene synthase family protein [Natronobacterium gregoryi]|uniref:Phytoene synthase n=2 Tax=Natronobacterium gregoryi TaxID=44930 RepID=L0AJZ7_NATGS|nr:phytoene/squalene synthase family protein [Natronobacterium gregoryi]AFZ73385.1 phytoene/squalene synthetase [Natronobacterium gregoryi SP2]ELY68581.1 phytoene synthase [Natronobacterium gregoryi SP2]PLK19665.1 phytoene/squalene synthase family protein [Natronobacterium gregoryi SP2]SFI73529.1 phytoene synthase [Natronobacterium gregoryi]
MKREHVDEGKEIQKRTGKTFYLATRFLPKRVRHATHVLYAFFRIADEVVDDADGVSPPDQRAELESLRAQALGEAEPEDPVLEAFQELKTQYGIDDEEVDEFVDAMATDITKSHYETYADLESYMRGSAAAVGVMMTAIMEPEMEEAALPHAVKLGEAFQLTNFLRDVREDILGRDRIYLPQETLREYGVPNEDIETLEYTDSFARAMAHELERAEELYRDGVAGIRYLPEDCQLPVLLAAVLYAEHHALIREQEYDVLSSEPSLSTTRKLWCVAKTRWHWHWNRDPEAVFQRVSAVPTAEPGTEPDLHSHEPGDSVPTQ